ncbi:acyl carrier protein [Streptacidiphilus albus]|uniref:acyl carrier protein n=1 Tax=Streptacidiphilus albus TaxID=105425 RepID=UPI00054B2A8A|nr:acyl carrier protein [Streptacidiphilus albus]
MSSVQMSLHAALTAKFEVPASAIVPDATLESLGLDSLSLAELALVLQEDLGLMVEEYETTGGTTVGELTQVLTAKRAASAGAGAGAE